MGVRIAMQDPLAPIPMRHGTEIVSHYDCFATKAVAKNQNQDAISIFTAVCSTRGAS
jgi:hypothetical protein